MNAGGRCGISHNYQLLWTCWAESILRILMVLYGNQAQSDLNNPNRQVVCRDAYGYNYKYSHCFDAFTQFKFSYDKIDFYLAQSFSSTNYQEGMYKNGI
jgi:hypothetical protein